MAKKQKKPCTGGEEQRHDNAKPKPTSLGKVLPQLHVRSVAMLVTVAVATNA